MGGVGKPPREKASEVLEPAGLEGAEEAQGGSAPGGAGRDPVRLPRAHRRRRRPAVLVMPVVLREGGHARFQGGVRSDSALTLCSV